MPRAPADRRARLVVFPALLALGYLGAGFVWIAASDRLVASLVSDPVRLTWLQSAKGFIYVGVTAGLLYLLVRMFALSLTRAERSLEAARLDFRRLVETTREGVSVCDEAGRTIFVNDRLAAMVGVPREELLRDGLDRFVVPVEECPSSPAPIGEDERCLRRPTGELLWVIVSESPVTDAQGKLRGTLRMVTDNTARHRAADELARAVQTQRVLMDELNHRVRNNLASLVAIIEISAGTRAADPRVGAFARSVAGRVRAMSAGYNLLAEAHWRPIPLAVIVDALTASAEERRTITGPAVAIAPELTVPLIMILHELLTNALEHGSLSTPGGRLDVRWSVAGEGAAQTVNLTWSEPGAAPESGRAGLPAPEPGFGLATAQGMAASDLRGRLTLTFPPEGARHTLSFPLGPTGSGEAPPSLREARGSTLAPAAISFA